MENIDLKIEEDVNLEDIEIKELKIYENKQKEKDNIRNKHLIWFFNKNFSWAYDSITTIYIIVLYKYVEALYFNLFITEENFKLFFEHYNKFIKYLIDILSKQNDNLFFYNIYKNYIKSINNLNFLDIKDDQINNELLDDILIASTLRIFYNNTIFCITYTKSSKCNGLCKYKKIIRKKYYFALFRNWRK